MNHNRQLLVKTARGLCLPMVAAILIVVAALAPASADSGYYDKDGVYRLPYGAAHGEAIQCQPLTACAILLQPGEVVNSKVVGDSVQWIVDPDGNGVIYFKPVSTGLRTNMIIKTNKHIYYVDLVSVAHTPHAIYGFIYPDDGQQAAPKLVQTYTHDDASATEGSPSTFAIDPNYTITGKAPYKPLHAWNDGKHTFLEMPASKYPAPLIYSITAGQQEYVNPHPPQNGVITIDSVPDQVILTIGQRDDAKVVVQRVSR